MQKKEVCGLVGEKASLTDSQALSFSNKQTDREETMGRKKGERNRKSQALQPKKIQKFKRGKVFHQEDRRSPSPKPPPPSSQSLVGSDVKTENPWFDIVVSVDYTGGLKPEASVGTVHIPPLSLCPTTPPDLSIVPYEAPLSARTVSTRKTKKNITLSNHWNRKKFATLLNHFNPIPFVRERPSNIAAHQLLLTRLGLWSFLHLDFDRVIHSDLIKQLVAYYNPKKPSYRRSYVNGCAIMLSRAAIARALALPTKRSSVDGSDATRARPFMVSDEELLFVEELLCSWLVLQDDDRELPEEVMKIRNLIRERRVEDVDWAGLIWFMVKSELLKGKWLVNCYYASHMQLLLKNQKPQLFGDPIESVGLLDKGAAMYNEEDMDKSWSLEGPDIGNRGIGLFNEESKEERFIDIEENAVGVEESGREQKTEIAIRRCSKRRDSVLEQCMEGSTLYGIIKTIDFTAVGVNNSEGDKLQVSQTTVIPSPGKPEVELNATYKVQDREEEDVTSNDFECKETDFQQVESNCMEDENGEDHEFNFADGLLMNEDIDKEGQKIEHSSDLTTEGLHFLSKQETNIQQMGFVLAGDQKLIGEKLCIPGETCALEKKDGNTGLRLPRGEDKNEQSEGLATDDLFVGKSGELPDSLEKKISNISDCKQMDYQQPLSNFLQDKYGKDLESGSANYLLMNEDSNDEGLNLECSSDLAMGEMHRLCRQESDFQQMDLVFSHDKCKTEFGLNVSVEDQNVTVGKIFTSEEQCAIEMEDGNRELRLRNELSDGLVEDELLNGKAGDLHDSRDKKVGDVFTSTEQHDIKMEDGDCKSRLVHGKCENEFSEGLVKEELFDAKTGELLNNQEEEVGFSVENSMDGENQHAEIAMKDEKPELLGIHDSLGEGEEIVESEASGLNEFLGAEIDLQSKNAVRIEPFVEPFVFEREICMNLADTPFDNSLKREIDFLNDSQFEYLNETQKVTGNNSAAGESFDIDLCSEQAELWVSRLKTAAHKRAQMDNEINAMLLKKLEEKNRVIEHYEKVRRQEQHKHHKNMLRCERELYLLKSVLDEYRTALDEVHESFAQYRKRAQLPEEPVYVDHPDGGGKVILTAELESSKLKQEHQNP